MGVTNIHSANQVVCRAGTQMTDQARIMPFNKHVFLNGRGFDQKEVDAFSEVLRTPHRNKWVEYNGVNIPKPVANDNGLPVPTLYTSPGLAGHRSGFGDLENESEGPVELAYVIIVQGASGALFSKLRIFYSHFAVAAGIMEEALQDWSVVFSAAMLKRDVKSLERGGPLVFKKVESLDELVKSLHDERSSDEILLCC